MELKKGERFYIRRQENDDKHTGQDDNPKRPRRNGDGKPLRFSDERSEIAAYLVVVPGMNAGLFAPMLGEKGATVLILAKFLHRLPRPLFRSGADRPQSLSPFHRATLPYGLNTFNG